MIQGAFFGISFIPCMFSFPKIVPGTIIAWESWWCNALAFPRLCGEAKMEQGRSSSYFKSSHGFFSAVTPCYVFSDSSNVWNIWNAGPRRLFGAAPAFAVDFPATETANSLVVIFGAHFISLHNVNARVHMDIAGSLALVLAAFHPQALGCLIQPIICFQISWSEMLSLLRTDFRCFSLALLKFLTMSHELINSSMWAIQFLRYRLEFCASTCRNANAWRAQTMSFSWFCHVLSTRKR